MDVVLLIATVGGTSYLPRHFLNQHRIQKNNESSLSMNHYYWSGAHSAHNAGPVVTLSLGLSLSLFALALLEAAPSSWLLLLREESVGEMDENRSSNRIAAAYKLVLWSMSAVVVFFIPSCCGTQMLVQRAFAFDQTVDQEERKKLSFKPSAKIKAGHGPLQYIYKLCTILWQLTVPGIYFLIIFPIYHAIFSPLNRVLCRRRKEKGDPVLPVNFSNKERIDSSEVPVRGTAGTKTGPVLLLLRDASFRRFAVIGSLSGTFLVAAILAVTTPFVVETTSSHILVRLVSWLCATGILLSSVMNGFGSVSMPFSCLSGLFLNPVHPDSVANAEIELERARESLTDRRQEIKTLALTAVSSSSNRPPRASSSFSSSKWSLRRVMGHRSFSEWGDEVSQRKQQLLIEIDFVEALIDEMTQDVEEMRYSQQVSAQARTTVGRIRSWIGVVFSVILLVRLWSAVSSVWHQYHFGFVEHRSGADPITRLLLWLLGHEWVNREDMHTLSQFISLVLTAVLSSSQLRNFLRVTTAAHRRVGNIYRRCYCKPKCINTSISTDSSSNSSPSKQTAAFGMTIIASEYLFSHVVASLMCCYCVNQNRPPVPVSHRLFGCSGSGGTTRYWRTVLDPNLRGECTVFRDGFCFCPELGGDAGHYACQCASLRKLSGPTGGSCCCETKFFDSAPCELQYFESGG